MDAEVPLREEDTAAEVGGGDGCAASRTCLLPLNCTLKTVKMVKTVNFMLRIFFCHQK